MKCLRRYCCSVAVAYVISCPVVLYAQTGMSATDTSSTADSGQLAEVIVTAQRREQPLQDVPVDVSSFNAATLQSHTIGRAEDLETIVPSLSINPGTGVVLPFLRGIGNPLSSAGNEANTAMYLDGIYVARLPQDFLLFNSIDHVEVLKGPQGTLFGRNAVGGLINIITVDPSQRPVLNAAVGYGNFQTESTEFYASHGLGENLAGDLAFVTSNMGEGWGRNIGNGNETDQDRTIAARSKWLWSGPSTQVRLALDWLNAWTSQGIPSNAYAGTFHGYPLPPYAQLAPVGFYDQDTNNSGWARTTTYGASIQVRQDLSFAKLINTTAYRNTKAPAFNDYDYTTQNYFNAYINDKGHQTTDELQLISKSGSVSWIGGLYFLDSEDGYLPSTFSGAEFAPVNVAIYGAQISKSYAAYGQTDFEVLPQTRLTLGARFTHDEIFGSGRTDVDLPSGKVLFPGMVTIASHTYNRPTWKVGLDHHFTETVMAYLSQSRGYKAGVYNTIPFSPLPTQPETLDATELGLKTELFDRRLRLNGAVFYYNDKDPQVEIVQGAGIVLLNAGGARVKGADLDGEWIITHALHSQFGLAILNAYYTSFDKAPSTSPNTAPPYGNFLETPLNVAGNNLPRAPKFTANFGLTYTVDTPRGAFELGANDYYNSGYYWDPDNKSRQERYNLVEAQITWNLPGNRWRIRAYSTNLFGAHYYISEYEQGGYNGNPSAPAAPRIYGLKAYFAY
jgi:iron complex outermembrane receptor protein